MRSPDIEMAVRLYYEKPEITNADIKELGSKMATGLIRPVLEGLHSISSSTVSFVSSAHLNAKESRGNLEVLPKD